MAEGPRCDKTHYRPANELGDGVRGWASERLPGGIVPPSRPPPPAILRGASRLDPNLMQELRLAARGTHCARAQVGTLRERIIKIGAHVVVRSSGRYFSFSGTPGVALFAPCRIPHSTTFVVIMRIREPWELPKAVLPTTTFWHRRAPQRARPPHQRSAPARRPSLSCILLSLLKVFGPVEPGHEAVDRTRVKITGTCS
jgi:hypothetical protein